VRPTANTFDQAGVAEPLKHVVDGLSGQAGLPVQGAPADSDPAAVLTRAGVGGQADQHQLVHAPGAAAQVADHTADNRPVPG
jgi:hypothetical protein